MKALSLLALATLISGQGSAFLPHQHGPVSGATTSGDAVSPVRFSRTVRPKLSSTLEQTAWAGVQAGDQISVHASGRGKPWITMGDGHEMVASFQGESVHAAGLQSGQAAALSLTSADLDQDGVPDLITGVSTPMGGVVSVCRGNVDAIYPYSRDARARKANGAFTNAPFLSPARVFDVASAPD
ncbi:MAG TPA: hypothetical protein VLZ81_11070, partial [Blastocatellia bacterium]|nr:hypothetical protein [Blastocatellia bacterium]